MTLDISPLAPASFPNLPEIAGVELATVAAGIKYEGRTDLMLAHFPDGAAIAGVLTQSLTRSAPVEWCVANLPQNLARAIIVNSGNSNAFTGKSGSFTTRHMVEATANVLDCNAHQVMVASTGVIGEKLPSEKVELALPDLVKNLSANNWRSAADAIMTTDTFAKGATATAHLNGSPVTINGIAKGSGMIAPDMATMLSFIMTDANIPAEILQVLIKRAADISFNCMTVDGDTSTSDTLLLAATGKAGNQAPTDADDPDLAGFIKALNDICIDLAQQVARDGEGASKFITIDVAGAENDAAAKVIALSVANSPLVKTAIAGEDANWGRIVMAVGKAGERADRDKLTIAMGGIIIAEMGEGVEEFDEAPVAQHLKGQNINISIDVGIADGKARVWTCDLTHGYIAINADYRS